VEADLRTHHEKAFIAHSPSPFGFFSFRFSFLSRSVGVVILIYRLYFPWLLSIISSFSVFNSLVVLQYTHRQVHTYAFVFFCLPYFLDVLIIID